MTCKVHFNEEYRSKFPLHVIFRPVHILIESTYIWRNERAEENEKIDIQQRKAATHLCMGIDTQVLCTTTLNAQRSTLYVWMCWAPIYTIYDLIHTNACECIRAYAYVLVCVYLWYVLIVWLTIDINVYIVCQYCFEDLLAYN